MSPKQSYLACGLLLALTYTATLRADSKQNVLAAEKSWSTALTSGNLADVTRIASDDLTYTHASGTTDTMETYLEKLRSGNLKYTAFTYDPGISVRVFGQTAVVNVAAHVSSISEGKESSSHLQLIHVFVARQGKWQLVAHQSTRLPN